MHAKQEMRDREREIRKRIGVPRHEPRLASSSVRRAFGRSIIEIGARIAAEPQPRLARSR
jgi:predicted component of type VI protein secretion system